MSQNQSFMKTAITTRNGKAIDSFSIQEHN